MSILESNVPGTPAGTPQWGRGLLQTDPPVGGQRPQTETIHLTCFTNLASNRPPATCCQDNREVMRRSPGAGGEPMWESASHTPAPVRGTVTSCSAVLRLDFFIFKMGTQDSAKCVVMRCHACHFRPQGACHLDCGSYTTVPCSSFKLRGG